MKLIIGNYNYSSWSLRAWLALKLTNASFKIDIIRLAHETSKENLKNSNPSGKVPCLIYNNFLIWDTMSICEFLAESFPTRNLYPKDILIKTRIRSLCAEIHSELRSLRRECPMDIKNFPIKKEISKRTISEFSRLSDMVEDYLSFNIQDRNIFDCFMTPMAIRSRSFPKNVSNKTKSYFEKLLINEHYLEWEKKANNENWTVEYS